MTSDGVDEDISFAAYKLSRAREALSDQIAIIFRLKTLGLDADFAGRDLNKICAEYRRWQEYCTLLTIRKGMTRTAVVGAQSNDAPGAFKRFASVDHRSRREPA